MEMIRIHIMRVGVCYNVYSLNPSRGDFNHSLLTQIASDRDKCSGGLWGA